MKTLTEITHDHEVLVNHRLAEYALRIANAKMAGNLRTARNIERQRDDYLRSKGMKLLEK